MIQLAFDFIYDKNIKVQIKVKPHRKNWAKHLPALLAQHGHICHLCKNEMIVGVDRIHPDHVVPLSLEGDDEWHNLLPAHAECNTARQDLPLGHSELSERIVRAYGRVLKHRENLNKRLCERCGCDISHRDVNVIYCEPCRECRKFESRATWRKNNLEQHTETNRIWRENNPLYFKIYYKRNKNKYQEYRQRPDVKERRNTRRRKAPLPMKPCSICGKVFQPKRANHIVCSDECREIYNKEYNRTYKRNR